MKRQVAVIGLGRFGASLAHTLYSMGHDVLAIDTNERSVQNIASKITHAVQADATDEAILKELGLGDFDVAIVAMGSAIESSVLTTIIVKKLGVRYVIARAENELHGTILDKIGADKVVYPEREMGISVAHGLTLSDVLDYMSVTERYGVAKLAVPSHFVGKTLSELGFGPGRKWEVAVLLIQRKKEVLVTPAEKETVRDEDVLIVAGDDDRLEQLLNAAKRKKAAASNQA